MSVLTQKLEQASKLFQQHTFKKSLEAYQDCVDFAKKTREEQSVIHNILSTQATLEYILGDFDKSLATLSSILSKDPGHFLSLLRRSQVYKKKGKLGRALKDLQKIFVYCPDNLQISAFKVEIQHMLLKQGSNIETLSQSEEEDQQQDETLQLNFMNLKLIDRKSSDISAIKQPVQRKSRVTILGDTLIEYNQEDTKDSNDEKEDCNQLPSAKEIRIQKEIQEDDISGVAAAPSIKIHVLAPPKPKRSILKNKGTSIFIDPTLEDEGSKKQFYLGRQSKLVSMIKNIDGRFIPSASSIGCEGSLKEVDFRKSVSQTQPLFTVINTEKTNALSPSPKKSNFSGSQRKSCLKRPSFDMPELKMKESRSSKFDFIDLAKIDGKVLHQEKKEGEENNEPNSDSDNDGSSHNIFGNSNFVMTQDLKQKLGIGGDEGGKMSQSMKLNKKHSILKKSSVMMSEKKTSVREMASLPVEGAQTEGQKQSPGFKLKAKKSVMFNCTL